MSEHDATEHAAQSVGPSARAELRDAYERVRSQTEALSAGLGGEDQTPQSMPAASPVKWHRAHTSWFFETFVLGPRAESYQEFDPAYRVLFNSYYNGVGEQYPRPQRGLITRPTVETVTEYRAHVDAAMDTLLGGDFSASVHTLVTLGLQHEQQHQELLLTDLKHLWSHNPLDPRFATGAPTGLNADGGTWTEYESATTELGCDGEDFAFDNERPRHAHILVPFAIRDGLVTNDEWLSFMEDGGYTRPELWLDDGWSFCQTHQVTAPMYWRREDTGFSEFTLYGRRRVQPSAPVSHVSFYEADAYARWAGARLPSESEWEHAAPEAPDVPLGGALRDLHPAAHTEDAGYYGATWQWTRSDYAAYPGYRMPRGAVGEYNGKFMSGQYVLRGSSCVTGVGHARRTYRNFFQPHARWQFTGLRLARDL